MITLHAMRNVDGDKLYAYDFCGLSTDEKPQTYGGKELEANSLFLELDTGDFYYLETPAQSGKEDLIPQTSFIGEQIQPSPIPANYYAFVYSEYVFIDAPSIKVLFDGEEYEVSLTTELYTNMYGARRIDPSTYDFSEYPFCITIITQPSTVTVFMVEDGNEHTIEVYTDSSTPAVWKKVGSGASPSGDDAVVGTAIVGTSKVAEGEEPQEVVLIPETTFTTNEYGSYNFVGVEAFKYSQIKIVLNGEEKIVDGTKPGDTYVYIFSGSIPNAIAIVTGAVMSKPIVAFNDSINQEPTTYTIKVIKITDEEILGGLPDDPQ